MSEGDRALKKGGENVCVCVFERECVCPECYGGCFRFTSGRPVERAGLGDTRYPFNSTNHQEITEAQGKNKLTEP